MKDTSIKERPSVTVKERPSLLRFYGWSGRFVGLSILLASLVRPELLWDDGELPTRIQGALIGFAVCFAAEVVFHRVYVERHQRGMAESLRDIARYSMRTEANTRETARSIGLEQTPENVAQR